MKANSCSEGERRQQHEASRMGNCQMLKRAETLFRFVVWFILVIHLWSKLVKKKKVKLDTEAWAWHIFQRFCRKRVCIHWTERVKVWNLSFQHKHPTLFTSIIWRGIKRESNNKKMMRLVIPENTVDCWGHHLNDKILSAFLQCSIQHLFPLKEWLGKLQTLNGINNTAKPPDLIGRHAYDGTKDGGQI